MSSSSITKRLLLYATDTYKLSSLILRNVLLTKPTTTFGAYQEKTRQVLLDSANKSSNSNNNVTAIKLLEWDKELNLIQYYGIQEYTKRWWNSGTWSFASVTSFSSSSKDNNGIPQTSNTMSSPKQQKDNDNNNVARVSFMITSKQRHILSTQLGYTTQDIRSFKPIEALLLIEHGVKRNEGSNHDSNNDSFRIKLKKLMKENDRLMNIQHQQSSQQQQSVEAEGTKHENANTEKQVDVSKSRIEQSSIISPEISQQIHVKPDVAAALLSVDGDVTNHEIIHSREMKEKKEDTATEIAICDDATTGVVDNSSSVESIADTSAEPSAVVSDTTTTAPKPVALVNVSSIEAEDLHMKPDVAAVILSSHQQRQDDNDSVQQELHVHETVIEEDSSEEEIEEGGTWYSNNTK